MQKADLLSVSRLLFTFYAGFCRKYATELLLRLFYFAKHNRRCKDASNNQMKKMKNYAFE